MKVGGLTGIRLLWQITLLALGFVMSAQAGPKLDTSDPLGFFTNLASRLLQSELNLSLTRIQVYPTNQYTPAVHRLLQVTANILDATTNRFNTNYPYFPSVFRPVFTNEGSNVYIAGFVAETNTMFLTNTLRDIIDANAAANVQRDDLIFGVPLVIGAKKGLPNFNEFAMQTVFQITRKLEIVRSSLSAPQSTWRTNMMYVLGISNVLGVEMWNSYRSNYTRPVDIYVTNFLTMTLTNDLGLQRSLATMIGSHFPVPNGTNATWPGFDIYSPTPSFVVPFRTNIVFLPDSAFVPGLGFTTNWTMAWDTSQTFPTWQWGLAVTNRLVGYIVDHDTQCLLDCVLLRGLDARRDLGEEIRDPDNAIGFEGLWSTNRIGGVLPQGILNQISIALGMIGNTSDWTCYELGSDLGKDLEIDSFRVLYGLTPLNYPGLINTSLVQQVPFTPTKRRISQYLTWQANDPLVHYTIGDLTVVLPPYPQPGCLNGSVPLLGNIGRLNDRFSPWGGNPVNPPVVDPNAFNLQLKDPLIRTPDDWSFPNAEPFSLAMLGRVHRGTPWQTVYLKYLKPTADPRNPRTGLESDWRLAGLLASLLNTNGPRQLLSVNDPETNAWLAVLNGVSVLTNSSTDAQLGGLIPTILFDTLVMSSNSPQAAAIADAIARSRADQPGQSFRGLGDILSVPELSTDSPWLNLSSVTQLQKGISDEAYEKIPAQLLVRLRPDSIGSLLQTDGASHIQFTGFDDYPYAVEVSSNLVDWVSVSTNYPTNGVFEFAEPFAAGNDRRFYRSVLLP